METISTTEVGKIIGFSISIDKIKSLGIEPITETKTGAQWEKARVWKILRRLGADLTYRSAKLHHEEMLKQDLLKQEMFLPELPF